jgi:hypothetical protein
MQCTALQAIKLTKEHNPTVYDERVRIQKAGGTVKDGRVLGILEVSRSIVCFTLTPPSPSHLLIPVRIPSHGPDF